jgi:hypothetical protein
LKTREFFGSPSCRNLAPSNRSRSIIPLGDGNGANNLVDLYEPCEWLADPTLPRLLFSPANPNAPGGIAGGAKGSWVAHRYEDKRIPKPPLS